VGIALMGICALTVARLFNIRELHNEGGSCECSPLVYMSCNDRICALTVTRLFNIREQHNEGGSSPCSPLVYMSCNIGYVL